VGHGSLELDAMEPNTGGLDAMESDAEPEV
jgi:hypothetical protein